MENQKIYDACIIGGGIIGCAIARELSRYDISVLLLEAKSDVAEGTTKANSAIVHAGYDARPGSHKARTNVAGNALFATWCSELDVPFARNTSLVVAYSPQQLPSLQLLLERGRENGVPGLSIIDEKQLRQREPHIGPSACGALLAKTGGICCPYELTIALAAHAVLNGLDLRLNCKAEKITREDEIFNISSGQGEFRSRCLLNAAGVYADTINNQLSSRKMKIIPRRGEYWMLDKSLGAPFKATIFQVPTDMGKGVLVTPTVEGTLILGPTAEDIADKEDTDTTADKLEEILRVAATTWRDIPRDSFITSFSGLRAHLESGDFILGEAPDVPGFYNAAGIESPGLTSAPAIACELSHLVAKRLRATKKDDFLQPYRAAKPFREMSDREKAAAIERDPAYGRIICRCEQVSEAEVRAAIRRPVGATTVDGVKRRTRAGMGRCQGGFCLPRVLDILSEELSVSPLQLTKFGGRSYILSGRVGENKLREAAND